MQTEDTSPTSKKAGDWNSADVCARKPKRQALAAIRLRRGRLGDGFHPFLLLLWPRLRAQKWTDRISLLLRMWGQAIARLHEHLPTAFLIAKVTKSLQGARHAVVATLYSRAGRIGGGVVSWCSGGLC